jgi:hypothetical protein
VSGYLSVTEPAPRIIPQSQEIAMSEESSTGLEGLVEELKERANRHAGEKTPEGTREAQICGSLAKYLAALDKEWQADEGTAREQAGMETREAVDEFRRNFGRDLTPADITSHVDSLTAGGPMELGIRMSIERLTAQGQAAKP